MKSRHDTIQRYYRAYRDRDRDVLRRLLAPDFHFVSPFGEFRDRDAMLDLIWPSVGQAWATKLRIFGDGDGSEFVVLYEHEMAPGAERPPMRMAEYVRFEGDVIMQIEVFVGRQLSQEGPAPAV
jgi:ketosteroid isomerase-like protein